MCIFFTPLSGSMQRFPGLWILYVDVRICFSDQKLDYFNFSKVRSIVEKCCSCVNRTRACYAWLKQILKRCVCRMECVHYCIMHRPRSPYCMSTSALVCFSRWRSSSTCSRSIAAYICAGYSHIAAAIAEELYRIYTLIDHRATQNHQNSTMPHSRKIKPRPIKTRQSAKWKCSAHLLRQLPRREKACLSAGENLSIRSSPILL